MKYFPLIFSSLFRRKRLRTFLTIGAVAVAFLLFGILSGVRVAFSQGIEVAGQERLITRNKVSLIQLLPESHKRKIEQIDGVAVAAWATWFDGVYIDPKNFFPRFPVTPDDFLRVYPEYVVSDEERAALDATKSGAIAGRKLAEQFGWKVGDRIPIQPTIWRNKDGGAWEFDLVGIYEGSKPGVDETLFFFRHDYFHESRAMGEGMIGWYYVQISEPERAAEIAELVDAQFENSAYETKTEPEGAFVQGFANQFGNIALILTMVLVAVFFAMLLATVNTMQLSVRERTSEIGLLKALGYRPWAISSILFLEALFVCALGGLLGLGGAFVLEPVIEKGLQAALPVFFIPKLTIPIGVAIIAAMAVVTCFFPILRAWRLETAGALRR